MSKLLGPFSQILTMTDSPILEDGGILLEDGKIARIAPFKDLYDQAEEVEEIEAPSVCLPGFIDCHTHICYGGSRVNDYLLKLRGVSYQEIAKQGGGILHTVQATRKASRKELLEGLRKRCFLLLARGVTTCEVKSGYGLTVEDEIKMLEVIEEAKTSVPLSLISTCLAAHTIPQEFTGGSSYLQYIGRELLPKIQKWTTRVDIFVEKNAFSEGEARDYLLQAKKRGFDLVVHGDQFSSGGAKLAAEVGALSADHLEHISKEDIAFLAKSKTIPVVLPGASLGLGLPFAPARLLLDAGLPLAIASDWNPGSAPMGDLLTQAALLAIHEKISMMDTFAAITCRAAKALKLEDRGSLKVGYLADLVVFPTNDYREILYYQGSLRPSQVFKRGKRYVF